MRKDIQLLPGVTAIAWVSSNVLPERIDLRAMVGENIQLIAQLNEITFTGEPECKLIRQKEGHAYTEEAELSFTSAGPLKKDSDIAIVVKCANGNSYIIGSREHPMPVIESERNLGAPKGATNAFTIKVNHKALKSLIRCSV